MLVPGRINETSRLCRLCRVALLALLVSAPVLGRAAGLPLRIPLDSLGFEPQSPQFLAAGGSMLTVNYVDNRHLLFTFSVHRLMERIPSDPPDDEDRTVEAVLVELPSGHVLARTDWRFHDHGQYLWNLGHGRFMLRAHDTLTTFAPMANLDSGQPFRQRDFLTTDRRIGVVLVSPESDLMIVESAERTPPVPPQPAPLFGPTPKPTPAPIGRPGDPAPVALSFYRLAIPGSGELVEARLAGVAYATHFGDVAAMGAGHLAVVDEGRQHWAFDFRPYNGKTKELAPFASTCDPMPRLVSSSEFVAFGCHTSNIPTVLGGFNMRGDEMWEQNLYGEYVGTYMTFAPESGRFALGRVMGVSSDTDLQPTESSGLTGQSVVVYQMESGKQLLHVDCSPIVRSGQNFALSPDGMSLAVIREAAINIYGLPPLSKKDEADLKEARAMVPEESILPIDFAGPSPEPAETAGPSPSQAASVKSAPPSVVPAASLPAAAPAPAPAPPAPQPATTTAVGDTVPDQPRKRPTLYTLPGDKAPDTSSDSGPK